MRIVQSLIAIIVVTLASISFGAEPFDLPSNSPYEASTTMIPMRDGAELAGDLYVPKSSEGKKFPVILIQTPYDKNRMRMAWFGMEKATRGGKLFSDPAYAFVITDWRGRAGSRAALKPGIQPGGTDDGFDTIAWIVKQPWSDGKVGTWGPSALGGAQFRTAAGQPPNLVCSVPMVMPLNLTHDVYYDGGVLWEEFIRRLGGLGWDRYGQISAAPLSSDPAWSVVARNAIKPEQINVPLLLVGGWFDIYVDHSLATFETLRRSGGEKTRAHSKLIIGPWLHRTDELQNGSLEFPNAVQSSVDMAHRFFDFCLRGKDNGYDKKEAAITYYQMGANEWRTTDVWPPKSAKEQSLYLHGDKSISSSAPGGKGSLTTFKYDPANPAPTHGGHVLTQELSPGPQDQREKVESRDDTIEFTTAPLESDLPVAGKIKLKLFVSSDRTDTDFSAILTDVYPDGRSILMGEGIQRMRFRNGTEKEELIEPGKVYPITIELNSIANTFVKGHRIRVIVSSSNFPKYAKNLNDGGPMYEEGRKGIVATNTIYHDAEHPSVLVLPVDSR